MALTDKEQKQLRTEFGKRVRALRAQLPAGENSQDTFARNNGFHKNWLGHVERGERAPSLYSIAEFARAFGITPSELLRGMNLK